MGTTWIHSNLPEQVQKAVRDVDRYDEKTKKMLQDAIRSGTEDTMRSAIRHVHTKSGNLVSKISMDYNESINTGYVKSKAHHSWLVEHGAGIAFVLPRKKKALKYGDRFFKLAKIPPRKPHPFMQTAIDETAPKITAAVEEAVDHD